MKYALLLVLVLSGCDCSSVIDGDLLGRIKWGSENCEYNLDYIELESGGGWVKPAIRISNSIKLHDTTTRVLRYCSSACVLISSSGLNREICARGRIGLHAGSTRTATRQVLEFYRDDSRVDYEAIKNIIINTPYSDIHNLTPYEARNLGLVDSIVFCTFDD